MLKDKLSYLLIKNNFNKSQNINNKLKNNNKEINSTLNKFNNSNSIRNDLEKNYSKVKKSDSFNIPIKINKKFKTKEELINYLIRDNKISKNNLIDASMYQNILH